MQIVIRSMAGDIEVDVDVRNPDATLADLLRGAHPGPLPAEVWTADRWIPVTRALSEAGIHDGAVVSTVAPPTPAATARLELAVVAGLDAGRVFPLPPGEILVGRGPMSTARIGHQTVSRAQCRLEVDDNDQITVVDCGSENYTVVDGKVLTKGASAAAEVGSILETGAVRLEIRTAKSDDRPQGLDLRRHIRGAVIPFNRPPRPANVHQPAPVEVPKTPTEKSKVPFSVASFVGPLVLAGVMVLATQDLRFALFSVLSPVIGVGTWYESKRRNKKEFARDRDRYDEQVVALRSQVEAARALELERLKKLAPDPAESLRRARLPSVRLWERRDRDDDFLRLYAGMGNVEWATPVRDASQELAPEVKDVVSSGPIERAPIHLDLADGGVLGIAGDREAALAFARSVVCQAAVHHGPADVTISVFVDPGREPDWEWSKWLPQTARLGLGAGARWLSSDPKQSESLLRSLDGGAGHGTLLLVLDSDVLTEGKDAPARDLLQSRREREGATSRERPPLVSGVVVAPSADRLPAACNTVVELVGEDGDAWIRRLSDGKVVEDVLLAGLSIADARSCARDLARFEDPELSVAGSGLPKEARLLPLLEMEKIDADSIRKRWRRTASGAGARTPLGVTESGTFLLDLVHDGPHGLIAGTTGAGKSELLRSLVAGLAAQVDPEHLTFVLVDYKGGAAFDECARLPHTVGLVTDLDEQLGERALIALEAELHHRERLLRKVHADNISQYLASSPDDPLPRLVLVVDEFATMAADLPDFIPSLVGIAQRGRTLGVHMILATQRPAGVVNDNIRANTNLRIALRVQDPEDSLDVIDSRHAAEISRSFPGRAYVRLGPGERVPIQTALVTSVSHEEDDAPLDVAPFRFGPTAREPVDATSTAVPDGKSDLARLVDAIIEANEAEEMAPPRRPWPEPLPTSIGLPDLGPPEVADPKTCYVALADDPRRQRQYAVGWSRAEGNLLLYGIAGSGTTTTMGSIAVRLAADLSPDDLELYAVDFGVGDLRALEQLPHTGAVILAGDRERQARLVRHMRGELKRRRGLAVRDPLTVIFIDNFAGMRAEFTDTAGIEMMDELTRVFVEGPEVGILFVLSAERPSVVPGTMASAATQKWVFRLGDPFDYSALGLDRKHMPQPIPGRAVVVSTRQQIQVARPLPDLDGAAARVASTYEGTTRRAATIGVLPDLVGLDELDRGAEIGSEPWIIPIGRRESDLGTAVLEVYDGEHITVAGPARSGKSTALSTIAAVVKGATPQTKIYAAGTRRSTLKDCAAVDRFAMPGGEENALFAVARAETGPVLLLIDDAHSFDDLDGTIKGLLTSGQPNLRVAAATSADTFRNLHGHWTKWLRQSKAGILLKPNIDLDGDLLGVTLPRRAPVAMIRGRGYLVQNGETEVVQVAHKP